MDQWEKYVQGQRLVLWTIVYLSRSIRYYNLNGKCRSNMERTVSKIYKNSRRLLQNKCVTVSQILNAEILGFEVKQLTLTGNRSERRRSWFVVGISSQLLITKTSSSLWMRIRKRALESIRLLVRGRGLGGRRSQGDFVCHEIAHLWPMYCSKAQNI